MQSAFDIPADLDTPVSAYLKLAPFEPRFLLESVEGGNRLGRFSFIGFGNADVLRLWGQELQMNGQVGRAPQDREGLLDSLRHPTHRLIVEAVRNYNNSVGLNARNVVVR